MTPADERPVLKADGGRMARAHGEREQNKSKKAEKKGKNTEHISTIELFKVEMFFSEKL